MTCTHCGDETRPWTCEHCGAKVHTACPECHNEIEHGRIANANIHICGSGGGMSADDDPDAYGRSE